MPRRRSYRANQTTRPHKSRPQKLVGRDLDLLLLAGCSCLLTVLYHPVTDALQSARSVNSQSPVAAQTSTAPASQTGSIYTVLPPRREEIREEEEA
ncbi:hypothetical protein K9N68_15300 [Kovacikia minuta CCNUW1]|uniref:hypothetical protein n=1 Tax=Kovacikia minuta TaxID=2931930 RepID=UPI001CC995FB|nr:hypothetical protein [Kovacikia minuta]UBF29077.1 hypothetical protein K9N68_15300 [Kovacikia minuta CCNUW1]